MAQNRSLRHSHWADLKTVVPVLLIAALIGGYYVYATSAASDIRPLLIDRNNRDNHAGVKAFACQDSNVYGDKLRVRIKVARPNTPKYNTKAISSNVKYGKITSRSVSGWTDNTQTYFINADKQDLVEVNVKFSNDYQETYPYIQHPDGRLAPVRADQLDLC